MQQGQGQQRPQQINLQGQQRQPNQGQQMRPPQQQYGQNRNQGGGFGQKNPNENKFLDFNQISEVPSKYPRKELPESLEGNMELGGSYQEFVYKLGDCCGNLRIVCPCVFGCCVDYPYQQIDQSYVGIY